MGAATDEPTPREVLGGALDEELLALDIKITRVWQLLGLGGLVASAGFILQGETDLGLLGAVALPFLAYFTVHLELLKRGRASNVLLRATNLVESFLPWVFLVAVYAAEGAAYALASWVPPMLFAAVLIASAARLRWRDALIAGAVGAVMYGTLYFAELRGALPPQLAHEPVFQPWAQLSRMVTCTICGAAVALVAHALREAIGRAEGTMREQDLFGKYRLLRHVASGGMGSVHQALYCPEGGFERAVAIKRVHPHLARQPKFVEAFRKEAALGSRLVHTNVVQVLDFGSIGDTYFLAMEYVDGLTLASFMRRQRAAGIPMMPELVAHVGRALLAGLGYAHGGAHDADGALLRVVHRDLCPANVLLSRHGEVKISDFGVARALGDSAATETKTIAGHLSYIAPEQARGQPLDPRCDLFALGIVMWEMLCGEPLFERATDAETLVALAETPVPSASERRDDIDPAWDAFLLRALERSPGDRFADAAEMGTALAAIADAQGGPWDDEFVQLIAELLEAPDPLAQQDGPLGGEAPAQGAAAA
jgi:serine/threonine-protein kinase